MNLKGIYRNFYNLFYETEDARIFHYQLVFADLYDAHAYLSKKKSAISNGTEVKIRRSWIEKGQTYFVANDGKSYICISREQLERNPPEEGKPYGDNKEIVSTYCMYDERMNYAYLEIIGG